MYVIIELQKTGNTLSIVPPASFSDIRTAEQAYHTALAAAAVSSIDVHSVVMLDENGSRIKGETYYHAS